MAQEFQFLLEQAQTYTQSKYFIAASLLMQALFTAYFLFKTVRGAIAHVRWSPALLYASTRKIKDKGGLASVLLGLPAVAFDSTAGLVVAILGGFRWASGKPKFEQIILNSHGVKLAKNKKAIGKLNHEMSLVRERLRDMPQGIDVDGLLEELEEVKLGS